MLGTSCQNVPAQSKLDILLFELPKPTAPDLVEVPSVQNGAIMALTINLSRLVSYSQLLEDYSSLQNSYYHNLFMKK
jgi:hypothetical protein